MRIATLSLSDCKLNKTCFDHIADHLPRLFWLHVTGGQVSADALAPITRMEHLHTLDLTGSPITDEHLLAIKPQTHLRILTISDTAVTNLSLKHVLENFPRVFSVRAENVAFDRGIFKIVASATHDRQFDVIVSNKSVSREDVESEGEDVSRRIKVTGPW